MPRFLSAGSAKGGRLSGRKAEELRGKAVKVLDLLQLAVELGHTDALYKLAQVSLVCARSCCATVSDESQFSAVPVLANVTRAFESYQTHASLTGNATSQSMLAFFHDTGYKNVVEINQAKALLHYTFAAYGEDRGAQMALGYRYWAGIGVNDDCMQALEWYQLAAEQGKRFAL